MRNFSRPDILESELSGGGPMSTAMTVAELALIFFALIPILSVVGIFIGCAVLFIAMNWSTVIGEDFIAIRRIVGWRTSLWYVHKNGISREFGTRIAGKDELVLKRSVRARTVPCEPIWEIYFTDLGNDRESVISFFPDQTINVRERGRGFRWTGFRFSKTELEQSRYGGLVQRAEALQREIEKRFRLLLKAKLKSSDNPG